MATEISIGIQTFSEIRSCGTPYIDKTPLVYRLARSSSRVFLSRPRRFGKSLLVSTLKSYFEGDQESFRGTAMEQLEQTWETYPVLLLDMGGLRKGDKKGLPEFLDESLTAWERRFGITEKLPSTELRFSNVLSTAHEVMGKKVVLLIDEYDKALVNHLNDRQQYDYNRDLLCGFYAQLKPNDEHLRFVLCTGVSRFAKNSIFSDFNNLFDISFIDDYSTLCGLTLKEIRQHFGPEIRQLARHNKLTVKACYERLREMYDGYLFSPRGERVYNPFSVLNCLASKQFGSYWHGTGTPTFLVDELRCNHYNLKLDLTRTYDQNALVGVDGYRADPMPLLYQTGYLTLDKYNREFASYNLRYPNREVVEGFFSLVASRFLCPKGVEDEAWYQSNQEFVLEARGGQPAKFMRRLKSLFDERPYVLNVESVIERDVQNCFYIIFRLMGLYVDVEQTTNHGRIDITLQTPQHVYLFELKIDAPAQAAVQQIMDKGYANRFARDERDLFLVGIGFSSEAKTIGDYLIERREGAGYKAVPNEAEED